MAGSGPPIYYAIRILPILVLFLNDVDGGTFGTDLSSPLVKKLEVIALSSKI